MRCTGLLHRTPATSSPGMCLAAWVVLLLALCPSSLEMALDKSRQSSTVWHTYEIEKGQDVIKNFKRHSDGTFTSDFTHYLDKIKAKDFVEWLTSNKHVGCDESQPRSWRSRTAHAAMST